ncbi:O-antigen ligase [Pseudomonas pohangensis]|uniref:O-antigen ligase n=1 Tax=Pseudomonas pohangensis TaxID=364197 RepID=A0A1H2E461_9PSED|nr:Wzy polymerase domain-containing protein [Pseudomonas pohangensis]SDT89901.1 O-antigen ligase [Pseudomonas pohangensis]
MTEVVECQKLSQTESLRLPERAFWWLFMIVLILAFLQPFHGGGYPGFLENYVLAAWVIFLFGLLVMLRGEFFIGSGLWVWLLFGVMLLVGFFTQSVPFMGPINQYFACWLVGFAVMQHAARFSLQDAWSERSLAIALVILGLLSAVFGIVRFYGLVGWFSYLLPEPASGRMNGLQGQSNFFAVLCFLGCIGSVWLRRLNCFSYPALMLVLLPMFYGIALSGTRVVYLAFFSWIFILFLMKGYKDTLILVGVMGVLYCLLRPLFLSLNIDLTEICVRAGLMPWGGINADLFSRGAESLRWVEWPVAWKIMKSAWPLGVGAGGYPAHSYFMNFELGNIPINGIWLHSHNSYLQLIIEFGLVGAIFLLCSAFLVLKIIYKFINEGRGLYLGSLATLLVYSFFEFPFWSLHFFVLFIWVVFAGCNWRSIKIKNLYGIILIPISFFIFIHYVSLYTYVFKASMSYLWPNEPVDFSYANTMIRDPILEHYGYQQYLESPTYSKESLAKDLELSRKYYNFIPYSSIVSRYIISLAASGDRGLATSLVRKLSVNDPLYRKEFINDVNSASEKVPSWDIKWLIDEWRIR